MTDSTPNPLRRWSLWSQRLCGALILALPWVIYPPGSFSASEPGQTQSEASIARLSDKEVRELLIAQLARGNTAVDEDASEFNPAVTMLIWA